MWAILNKITEKTESEMNPNFVDLTSEPKNSVDLTSEPKPVVKGSKKGRELLKTFSQIFPSDKIQIINTASKKEFLIFNCYQFSNTGYGFQNRKFYLGYGPVKSPSWACVAFVNPTVTTYAVKPDVIRLLCSTGVRSHFKNRRVEPFVLGNLYPPYRLIVKPGGFRLEHYDGSKWWPNCPFPDMTLETLGDIANSFMAVYKSAKTKHHRYKTT